MSTRSYHHGDLRNALIAHGVELLEETGLEQLSLRSIAARAGVSHAAPKNHFGSLRGLLTAMATEGFQQHAAFMREGLPRRASRKARLSAAMKGYVRFAQKHPHLFSLMFSSQLCDYEDAELQSAAAESYQVLREIAEGLDWDKATKPQGALRAEMMLWSLVHGFAQLSIAGQFGRPGETPSALDITDVAPAFNYLMQR